MFFEDTRSSLATMRKAFQEGDAQSVERIVHTLKGSSSNMGATRMAAICSELEGGGVSGDLTTAPALLERLDAEFERVRSALTTETEAG